MTARGQGTQAIQALIVWLHVGHTTARRSNLYSHSMLTRLKPAETSWLAFLVNGHGEG